MSEQGSPPNAKSAGKENPILSPSVFKPAAPVPASKSCKSQTKSQLTQGGRNMCHQECVEQLQADLKLFTVRAENGDETAARAAEQTALELQRLGVKPSGPRRMLFKTIDPRVEEVSPRRSARLGFADVR